MVYDSFQFFNELDILYMRMNILSEVVDRFVVVESTVTFSGDAKPLYFEENRAMFRDFEDRIIHVVVEDTPMDCDAFTRDHHQKCAVKRGLAGCGPDDIVIFSDVDEIPDPKTLKRLLPTVEHGRIYMLAQRLFYGYLNLEDISGNNLSVTGEFEGANPKRWLGTKICRYDLLDHYTTEELRNSEQKAIGIRVDQGGWHFSYMGGGRDKSAAERIRYKLKSAAHQEYNNPRTLLEVGTKLRRMEDFMGRDSQMVIAPVDETYPDWLRDHLQDYRYLLYSAPKWYETIWDWMLETALTARRGLRGLISKGR